MVETLRTGGQKGLGDHVAVGNAYRIGGCLCARERGNAYVDMLEEARHGCEALVSTPANFEDFMSLNFVNYVDSRWRKIAARQGSE